MVSVENDLFIVEERLSDGLLKIRKNNTHEKCIIKHEDNVKFVVTSICFTKV